MYTAMQSYLRKTLVGFVVAAILIVAFHQALAESDLIQISPMVTTKQEPHVATCENLSEQYGVFQKRLVDDGAAVETFTAAAAADYMKWYEVLGPKENHETPWPEHYFLPIDLSATLLEKTSSDLYTIGSEYEAEVSRMIAMVRSCYIDNEARAQVLREFDLFTQVMTESQGTTADFFGQMQARLRDGAKEWHGLETKKAKVPTDFFQLLKHDSEVLNEASMLLKENATLVADKYQPIVDLLSSLTKNPPPSLIVRWH